MFRADLLPRGLEVGGGGGEAYRVTLTAQEREALDGMISRGKADARKLDGAREAKLVALACSGPPEGRKRWTLRLLAERMVELEVVPELSHETVRQTLKKECAQAAPTADVVHPTPALGRVRVPYGRRAGGLSSPA